MSETLLFLIPLLPLCCAVINMLFGMRLPRLFAEIMAVTGVAGAFLLTIMFWGYAEDGGTRAVLFTWLNSGAVDVSFALNFDRLAAPMTLMVTGVATLIHLYAVGYMHEDDDYARFFGLLNLFVFAMLAIVLADNLLGWVRDYLVFLDGWAKDRDPNTVEALEVEPLPSVPVRARANSPPGAIWRSKDGFCSRYSISSAPS